MQTDKSFFFLSFESWPRVAAQSPSGEPSVLAFLILSSDPQRCSACSGVKKSMFSLVGSRRAIFSGLFSAYRPVEVIIRSSGKSSFDGETMNECIRTRDTAVLRFAARWPLLLLGFVSSPVSYPISSELSSTCKSLSINSKIVIDSRVLVPQNLFHRITPAFCQFLFVK